MHRRINLKGVNLMAVNEELENRFKYHRPSDSTQENLANLRAEIYDLAVTLDTVLPNSREKSLAITKVEEALMWAIAAVVRNGE